MILNPLGIEIEQTVFAYSPKTHSELANVIFIRYKISNTGLVNDLLDSVYFVIWSDPDIGDYVNDLVGSDTTLNSGYCYDNGIDGKYGINSPSFFSTLIQGPVSYIPNVTFNDVNNNNKYDEGIDEPLDTAKSLFGFICKQNLSWCIK
ncbi:MAG: hypothetical protein H6609_01660 [Ignavibacteriales bacterium]|nr:hypothetical protein [Ignavibacteriales bacterium]